VLDDLSLPRRALRVIAGCEARGKAQGRPFHPGVTGEGKIGRVKYLNPRLMLREAEPRIDGGCGGA